jgi:hypothetical protein
MLEILNKDKVKLNPTSSNNSKLPKIVFEMKPKMLADQHCVTIISQNCCKLTKTMLTNGFFSV